MKEYSELELNILSCLLIKPELMKEVVLEDKHFVKQQRMWQFMKSFYNKFQTFDIPLMYSVCKDKWHIINYIELLLDREPTGCNFNKYQKRLIEMYNEAKNDKIVIDSIFKLANDLYVRNITTEEFKTKTEEIYKKIEEGEI
jgi:replicative DNA helicase